MKIFLSVKSEGEQCRLRHFHVKFLIPCAEETSNLGKVLAQSPSFTFPFQRRSNYQKLSPLQSSTLYNQLPPTRVNKSLKCFRKPISRMYNKKCCVYCWANNWKTFYCWLTERFLARLTANHFMKLKTTFLLSIFNYAFDFHVYPAIARSQCFYRLDFRGQPQRTLDGRACAWNCFCRKLRSVDVTQSHTIDQIDLKAGFQGDYGKSYLWHNLKSFSIWLKIRRLKKVKS